jgi:hypothetical protein
MEISFSKKSDNQETTAESAQVVKALVLTALIMMPQLAMAQDGGGGAAFFCFIGNYFKGIIGGACLVVIMLWALEHLFGMAKLHDVVIKVGVVAAVVVGAVSIIKASGLIPPSCLI